MIQNINQITNLEKCKKSILKNLHNSTSNPDLKSLISQNSRFLFKFNESIDDLVKLKIKNPNQKFESLVSDAKVANALFQDLNLGEGVSFGKLIFNESKVDSDLSYDEKEMVMTDIYDSINSALTSNPNIEKTVEVMNSLQANRSYKLSAHDKISIEKAGISSEAEYIVFADDKAYISKPTGIAIKNVEDIEDLDIFESDYTLDFKHEYLCIDEITKEVMQNGGETIQIHVQYFNADEEGESGIAPIYYDQVMGELKPSAEFERLNFSDEDLKLLEAEVLDKVRELSLAKIKEESLKHGDVACRVSSQGIPVYVCPMAEIQDSDVVGSLVSFNHYHEDMREQHYNIDGERKENRLTKMSAEKVEHVLTAFNYKHDVDGDLLVVQNRSDEDCRFYKKTNNQYESIDVSELDYELRDSLENRGYNLGELRKDSQNRRKRRP